MKKKKEILSERTTIRFTKEEKERFIKKAKSKKLSQREFIMKAVDNADARDTFRFWTCYNAAIATA